jgi:hypothetical protein
MLRCGVVYTQMTKKKNASHNYTSCNGCRNDFDINSIYNVYEMSLIDLPADLNTASANRKTEHTYWHKECMQKVVGDCWIDECKYSNNETISYRCTNCSFDALRLFDEKVDTVIYVVCKRRKNGPAYLDIVLSTEWYCQKCWNAMMPSNNNIFSDNK